MSSLKGSSHFRQIKDMQIKLEARGTKKHTSKHKTHSNAQATKRDSYIKDFSKFATNNNLEGKLNKLMTTNNINNFLEDRLSNLSLNSIENYLSGWNSLLNGLQEVNITHSIPNNYLTQKWHIIKANTINNQIPTNMNRGLGDRAITVINELYEKRYESGLIAEISHSMGFRISEAMDILLNTDRFISQLDNGNYYISGVSGKGGHIYQDKAISSELVEKLKHIENVPSKASYYRDLKPYEISAHDFRYDFAKNTYKSKLENGVGHNQALKELSVELNHHRSSISLYYID